MGSPIREHISELLLSSKRHARYAAILACLALVVAVGVAGLLRQRGNAMTHEETVLDCQYDGFGAHTHDVDCYDADGNLVCPLEERELHVHDDSCYEETSTLVCGLEESEGHEHSDACYDDEGNLVCELEESEGHTHDDSCYETERELVCSEEEITEEHVHGPGCFTTVVVEDDEAEDEAEASDSMPAQTFEAHTNEKQPDDIYVYVEAPEGAFPADTTMKVKLVDKSDVEGAIDEAVAEHTDAKVVGIQTVDITFRNAEGQEIEPAAEIMVQVTSNLIRDNEKPLIVHVDNDGRGEVIDTLDEEQLAERDLEKADDQLTFDAAEFSSYSIVITSIEQTLTAKDGNSYKVTVDCPESAGIPQGAELVVDEIAEGSEEYDAYLQKTNEALEGEVSFARFFDITIAYNGEPVQPAEPVDVKIKLANAADLSNNVRAVHFAKEGPEIIGASLDGKTVAFQADGFSVYAVVDESDTTDYARMAVNFYGKDQTTPLATMYVKNSDTLEELQMILYDPGAGDLGEREVFKGWTTDPNYTVADGDNSLDIEQIRELAEAEQITETGEVNYYAIIIKAITATYLDENGLSLGAQNAYARHDATSADFTINMSYTPADDEHSFEGWNVSNGSSNIAGYTEGMVYTNGTQITISGDVTFSVNAPEGHWLVFDENGKGADYNAPRFIKSDEVTTEPPAPQRLGYIFGGWYTELSGEADETGCAPVLESSKFTFGNTISDKTTLYAKWIPADTSKYTILIWRQNLNGDGYDFAESISLTGETNTNINTVTQQGTGDDAYARIQGRPGGQNVQYNGFHLKEFDQNVKITPEGDAILNVYYDRNEYTLRFYYARSYVAGGTTTTSYEVAGTASNGSFDGMDTNTTYYSQRNENSQLYWQDGRLCTRSGWWWNPTYTPYNGRVYKQVTTTTGGRTYVQVNCNNDGFKQGRANGRNLEESLAYYLVNDYQRVDRRNTWKDVNNSSINGDATNLVSSEFLSRTGAELGTHAISGVTTDVIGSNRAVSDARAVVDMIYYYLDVKVRYEQSLAELWPTPNVAFNAQQMTSYNEANDTGNYTTITPLLVGTWSTGANIGGMYSTMSSDLFVGNDKVAYLDIYWRFERHYEYNYNVYFSTLEDESPTTNYNGKPYTLQSDLSYIVANGQGWGQTSQTDTGSGYYDVNTVTFNGTTFAGRHDVNDGNINVYYDRIVRHVNFNDGIYVDGNGNPVQNNKDQQLHTQAVIFGEELSTFNEGGRYYYRPDDTSEYVFEGWYLDPEGQQPYTFSGTMPTHDITVYAKWRQVQYRVFLHPNTTDTSLDWGSGSQSMNFRVSYGGKISAPTGTRNDYEFVGWYTDPACSPSSLFNADLTVLNETTVTADYDKTVDMTDVMDKWGNGATTNADLDRPWITKKFDLYAKWRAKLTGAQGIGVIYDANGGTKPPHDNSLYLDQAEATAQAASIAPSGEVFKYWVVQTWDEDAQEYRDTNITVLPGDNFTVLRDNARRQENPDHTPEKPSYTYTVCLRAEYTTSEEHTPTHIHFYGNIQDKDGNRIAGVTAAPDGNEPKDVTTYDGNIKINEAVDILTIGHVLGQQSNLYSGFKFLGWAKERDATEPWLKLNEDGTTYTVTQGGKTYSSVTQIAADERQPYDDFYAVWERKTYTVSVEKITEDAYKNELFGFSSTFNPALDQSVETSFTLVGNTDGATVDDVTYGHTKEFIEVPYGTKFTVTENDSDAANYNTVVTYDCTGADDASKNVTDYQVSTTRQSGVLTVDGNMVVKFTNTRKTEPVVFKKVDQTNQATILPNAEFTMVGPEDETYTLVSTSGTFKAKKDGTEVSELPYGVYTITETKEPAGYSLMKGTVTVTIAGDGVSYQQSDNGGGVPTAAQRDGEDGPYIVIITNNPGVELPMTGGPGTNLFTITGTALIVGALMYGSVSRRRNERRSIG